MLPDVLTNVAGDKINDKTAWEQQRRPEVLDLFRQYVYGRTPEVTCDMTADVLDEDRKALNDQAIRKQVKLTFSNGDKGLSFNVLMYLPKTAATTPAPAFAILNFHGNQTVNIDPAIRISEHYYSARQASPEENRGTSSSRYPAEEIVARGYGLVTAHYGDIDPDFDDGFENGIHNVLESPDERTPESWGSVGAWAWGLSRIMDYLEQDPMVNHDKVAAAGHSRLGKTALWAGAQDERFSLVISNNSGCTGAAISRSKEGETVKAINDQFPHWFCDNYKRFNENEETLPVDQHLLLALTAPRPLYVASATEDLWADPQNEFKSCVEATPAYELYGLEGVGANEIPQPETPLNTGHIGYHLRTGKHDLTSYDWKCFMDFADRLM